MIGDLPENIVENVSIAVVSEHAKQSDGLWAVYLINEKIDALKNVFVSSKGYGIKDGKDVKTTTLRHYIGDVAAHSITKIEAIDPQVFVLTNEYWLSYYIDGTIYDKKYILLPEVIVEEDLTLIPLLEKRGIILGGAN